MHVAAFINANLYLGYLMLITLCDGFKNLHNVRLLAFICFNKRFILIALFILLNKCICLPTYFGNFLFEVKRSARIYFL